MIVTIDGPAGAGKSSTARLLADRLSFDFLDTGAMYRAVALAALRVDCEMGDEAALGRLVAALRIDMPAGRMHLDGVDVSADIRLPAVTAATAAVADSPSVRSHLVQWQRRIGEGRDIVSEGRDQGTIVFPHACCKFFLIAEPPERARRRLREMLARGQSATFEEVLHSQEARDRRDAERGIAPMVAAHDAVIVDGTHLALAEVVDQMEREVRRRTVSA